VLLNDPTYVEAARAFAMRAMLEASGPAEERITWIFRQALGRVPGGEELGTLMGLHQTHLAHYSQDPAGAQELLGVGDSPVLAGLDPVELAAWTSVTRVVLNLHETITRN
jgi:hypothetical protein